MSKDCTDTGLARTGLALNLSSRPPGRHWRGGRQSWGLTDPPNPAKVQPMPTESAPFWCWNKQCRLYKKCHAGECEVPETDRTPVAGPDWSSLNIKWDVGKSITKRAGNVPWNPWATGAAPPPVTMATECSMDGQSWTDCFGPPCTHRYIRRRTVQP